MYIYPTAERQKPVSTTPTPRFFYRIVAVTRAMVWRNVALVGQTLLQDGRAPELTSYYCTPYECRWNAVSTYSVFCDIPYIDCAHFVMGVELPFNLNIGEFG